MKESDGNDAAGVAHGAHKVPTVVLPSYSNILAMFDFLSQDQLEQIVSFVVEGPD